MWGRCKHARVIRLHCTCRIIRASSRIGISTSTAGEAYWYALNGGSRALGGQPSGDRTRYREHVETRWILGEPGVTRGQHGLPECSYRWAFYIGCDPTGGVACQEGHNLQDFSLDSDTNNRHAARDDIGCYTVGKLQAMLVKPVCNAWSCRLHRKRCNTCSRHWDFVKRWQAELLA